MGVVEQTQEMIDALLDQARGIAAGTCMPCRFSKALSRLVDSLAENYFVVPASAVGK